MAKRHYPRFTSPAGVAVYPRIKTPSTNFDADGVFECKLAFENEDACSAWVEEMEGILKELREKELAGIDNAAKRKKVEKYQVAPIVEPELDDEGDETGRMLAKFKLKHIVRPKEKAPWKQRPAVFDAAGKQMKVVPNIGGGSLLVIGGTASFWVNEASKSVGLSLRMEGVQVLELVEFGSKDAAGFGFAAHESGFSAEDYSGPDEDEEADETDSDTGDDTDDDDDF